MPIYHYRCPCGYECDELRKMDDRHRLEACPRCSNALHLVIVAPKLQIWRPLELELEPNKPKVYNSREELKRDCQELGKIAPYWDINGDKPREV